MAAFTTRLLRSAPLILLFLLLSLLAVRLEAAPEAVQCNPNPQIPADWACELTDSAGRALGVALGPGEGLIAAGSLRPTRGSAATMPWLAKFTREGALLWERRPNASGSTNFLRDVGVDAAGDIYALGFVSGDTVLLKFNGQGQELWRRTAVPPVIGPKGLVVSPAGHAYVAGAAGGDALVQHFDPQGGLVWTRALGTGSGAGDTAAGIARDAAGNLYVTGLTARAGGGLVPYVAGLTAAGAQLWLTRLNDLPGTAVAQTVVVDETGGIYAAGGTGQLTGWIAALEESGSVRWLHAYQNGMQFIEDLALDPQRKDGLIAAALTPGAEAPSSLVSLIPLSGAVERAEAVNARLFALALDDDLGTIYAGATAEYGSWVGNAAGNGALVLAVPGFRPVFVLEGLEAGFCVASGSANGVTAVDFHTCEEGETDIDEGEIYQPQAGVDLAVVEYGALKGACYNRSARETLLELFTLRNTRARERVELALESFAVDCLALLEGGLDEQTISLEMVEGGMSLSLLHPLTAVEVQTESAAVAAADKNNLSLDHDPAMGETEIKAFRGALQILPANPALGPFALGPAEATWITLEEVGPLTPLPQVYLPVAAQ